MPGTGPMEDEAHDSGTVSMEESLSHGVLYKTTSVRCCNSIDYRLRFLIELTFYIASSSLLRGTFLFCLILETFLCPCCKYRHFRTIYLVTWER